MRTLTNLVLVGAVLALPVVAQDGTVNTCKQDGTVLNLSAQAHRSVAQDRVRVTLSINKEGKTAEEVQKAINLKMAEAKKIYDRADKDIKVSTTNYNVWQQDTPEMVDNQGNRTPRVTGWHGNQQVTIEAPAGKAVLKLVGDLQGAGLNMDGMGYYLSREAMDKLADDLMVEALGTIGDRAKKIGSNLGLSTIAYEEINSSDSGGGYAPVPMMAKAMMARDATESMPTPVGQAGESEVNLMVNAKVRLTK